MGMYKEWSFDYIISQASENPLAKGKKKNDSRMFLSHHKAPYFLLLDINAPKSSFIRRSLKMAFQLRHNFHTIWNLLLIFKHRLSFKEFYFANFFFKKNR